MFHPGVHEYDRRGHQATPDAVDVVAIAVAWNRHRLNHFVDALMKIPQS